ncbi:pentraxin fusion protein-like [Girardinichthys multiradiatus]|uniref:pentraxin fusion protein-like n=1 Tax=Girardinichthys multiradiatus TaxID=208333 RepID=UPI001FABC90D|nr:pentraxin fusion protein-like [Girardinichthys multiradiatus]XP_047212438.1 pentraxin fusion protein-like [Girardinichthys multiradiatus]XP_047212439.1 pentraxin fusion protein-like [Girardinichthys multiradiatus]XP_047212440.1 pentraxin fusion protein-like [Girardinichthys multiradiatus]XP_047214575.1 pentraxin fusion protein-like [Girardinichthys multiradiatus]XP_047214576.1 pentraxin fusion protein-like [Girardinichthys multiradiatus]XP_047214577.1 pentraxin fusion protein-like [Girardi
MRLSLVLLITISAVFGGSLAFRIVVFPRGTSNSYVEMTPEKPLTLKAFTLCMRVATELNGEREIILFAYRTPDYDELNVWRELDGRLSFYLSGSGVLFQVPDLGSLQNHLCFTWDSSSGAAALFMNGRKSVTKIYRKAHTIQPGGRVLIGQDPDNYLGGFDAKQSFVGEISDVNLWDSVLSDAEVQNLFHQRTTHKGNVIDWETSDLTPTGEVEVINVNP